MDTNTSVTFLPPNTTAFLQSRTEKHFKLTLDLYSKSYWMIGKNQTEFEVAERNSKDHKLKETEDGRNENGDIWAEPWRKRLRKKNKIPMKDEGTLSNEDSTRTEFDQTQETLSDSQETENKAEPKELVPNPTNGGEVGEEERREEDLLGENFENNRNLDFEQEENQIYMCEPFSMVETKMEVNEKEDIDPSRYVIVVENQKKKRRKIKDKIRGKSRKRNGDESYDPKKKHQRKQDNPKKKSKKNFACDICREELGNEEELETHRRMRHINEKSEFFCDFCLKIFKTKAILKGHRYKHITDPQFLCVRCGKKYFTISNLNEHSLYCLDEKKFECPVCNKKFNVNKQFKRHLVIHEADRYIKCTVCEQTFSRKDNYRQHFRRHTGEKPYTCDICGKSFRIKATYNYHRRTHSHIRQGELDNLKTETVNDSEYNVFRTPRKDLPPNVEYYCPRVEGENDFSIRIPRREGEYPYPPPHKDNSLVPEYHVKREPSEGEYPPKKGNGSQGVEENFKKECTEQKKEGLDYSQRLNVDYLTSTAGMDFSKREPSRSLPDFFSRKDEYDTRGINPQPEYLPRRVGVLTEEYSRGGTGEFHAPRRESGPEYPSYSNSTVREDQD